MTIHAIDFGTSNSLLNFVSDTGEIKPISLENGPVLRSLLYTPENNQWFFGQQAIDEYINHDGEGRFFRSIKKFLPEPSYQGTSIFTRNLNISQLVAVILGEMRKRANLESGVECSRVVMGRPALYSLNKEEDQLAEDRMRKACEIAGYKEIIFCPEPVAAGLDYKSQSNEEKIVLIADFGGGTSDFTLMKMKSGPYTQENILGLSGVFLAGDVLDGMMMRDFIAPHFGSKFEYQFPGSTNILTFPRQLIKKICSPAHITHLREREIWEFLQHIKKFSLNDKDEKYMQQLFTLVESQLGFPVFHEIEKTKVKLGKSEKEMFRYTYPGIDIEQEVTKLLYQESVTPTVDDIMVCMMDVFNQSGLTISDVDQVCLTGGTSQFPLIQQRLSQTFGKEKLTEYNIYHSVVSGLAHFAQKLI